MAAVLTTAGATHLGELDAGVTPTNSFDALIFGTGNTVPAVTDTQAQIAPVIESIIRRVESGYPILNDTSDARNPGAGASWWTWKFVLPASEPFVASNVAVTNYAGATFEPTTDLMVHSDQIIAQRYDERLIVYVNAQTGETPTVYTATETALQNRIQRVVGFTARTRAMSGYPNGSVVDENTVRTRPMPGQYVWTAADQMGPNGEDLAPEKVEWLRLEVEQWDGATRTYEEFQTVSLTPSVHVFPVPQYGDQRWNAQGGYNVAHAWSPPDATQESTWRIRYQMRLSDGDLREWRNLVEVRFGAD